MPDALDFVKEKEGIGNNPLAGCGLHPQKQHGILTWSLESRRRRTGGGGRRRRKRKKMKKKTSNRK